MLGDRQRGRMIIFPFGFFILEDRSPVYVGNDLGAQSFVRAWMEANPELVQLACEGIGPVQVRTRFLGWDETPRSRRMDPEPLLFESRLDGVPEMSTRRLHRDLQEALASHAELVEIARCWWRGQG